jgi:glycosyltransferase involved in cell wall biosynthesis
VHTLAGRARGDVVAFAELPAVQDPAQLVNLAASLGDADAVAGMLVDARTGTVAFRRGRFDARAFARPGEAGTLVGTLRKQRGSTLWFDRRAFAVRRQVLVDVGPPHPSCHEILADVDLGWRWWLAGHRIATTDTEVTVDDRYAGPWLLGEPEEVAALNRREGLALMLSMLEEDTVPRAIAESAFALHLGVPPERWREAGVLGDALPSLETLSARREHAQGRRTIRDVELFRAVGPIIPRHPFPLSGAPAALRRAARTGARKRVLLLCSDDVGGRLAGPAIRAIELGREIALQHDVTLAVHSSTGAVELPFPTSVVRADNIEDLLDDADAAIVQGPLSDWFPEILASTIPLCVDLYDPMNLEALEADDSLLVPYTLQILLDQLRRGDFFICASERQRDFWLGMLAASGRITSAVYRKDPNLDRLLAVAPFGISREPAARTGPGVRGVVAGIGADDPLFVWNGGLWDWFDPKSFVQAIDLVRRDVPNVRGYFMGTRRPGIERPETRAAHETIALAESLGLTGKHIFFHDWTPYDERQNTYLDATAVVSLHQAHVETRFSFRTRLLDCLWAGVPIVCTSGDVIADLVEDRGLGLTAAPGDVAAVADALRAIAADPVELDRMRKRVLAEAPAFSWERAATPILDWLQDARRAPGRPLDVGTRPPYKRIKPRIDTRTDPPDGSWKLAVPTPLRKHVLGPLKRLLTRDR